jgi:hopanoid C-2 methylase
MSVAYAPEKVFSRYEQLCDNVLTRRLKVPVSPEVRSWANIKRALVMLRKIFWKVGVLGSYRRVFWKFALGRLRRGDIEGLIQSTLMSHHLITFTRDATSGAQNMSNYSFRLRDAQVPAE